MISNNNLIINKFKELIKQMTILSKLNKLNDNKLYDNKLNDKLNINKIIYKLYIFNNFINFINQLKFDITSSIQLKKYLNKNVGIGSGIIKRVDEILKTQDLKEINLYKDVINNLNNNDNKFYNKLINIIGFGNKLVNKIINEYNIQSIKELKQKIKENKIKISKNALIGLKYYKKISKNIPRKEIKNIYIKIKNIIKLTLNSVLSAQFTTLRKSEDFPNEMSENFSSNSSQLGKDFKYKIKICGSYRRKKKYINDIDILIVCQKYKTLNAIHKSNIINLIKNNLNEHNLVKKNLYNKNIITKYSCLINFFDKLIILDIRFIPYKSYYTSLLFMTGSKQFNIKMRKIAKKMNYKLNEYGLYLNSKKIKIKCEKDIFKKLNMKFIQPKYRNI